MKHTREPHKHLEIGPVSLRWHPRRVSFVLIALALALGLGSIALITGAYTLSPAEILEVFRGLGDARSTLVVMEIRLPRLLTALLVGGALAGSGMLLQGIVRNPLVSPDIIGINAGAGLMAILLYVYRIPTYLVAPAAFAGALAAALIIYGLTWKGHISIPRLVLVGIGVNAIFGALTTYMTLVGRSEDIARAYQWLAGSLYDSGWDDVAILAISMALLVPLGSMLLHPLRVIQLGDSQAKAVGVRLETVRFGLLLISCGLAAVAVSATGPIGFVALMVPHLARMIAGPIRSSVWFLSMALGGILVLGADMITLHLLPFELPAGIITSALGAPYFLYLLYRTGVKL